MVELSFSLFILADFYLLANWSFFLLTLLPGSIFLVRLFFWLNDPSGYLILVAENLAGWLTSGRLIVLVDNPFRLIILTC
jgi:hypothetical protein